MTESTSGSVVRTVDVREATIHLSELLRIVAIGEEVEIRCNGVPIARLVPTPGGTSRVFGTDQGNFAVPHDFDAPLPPDLLADFAG